MHQVFLFLRLTFCIFAVVYKISIVYKVYTMVLLFGGLIMKFVIALFSFLFLVVISFLGIFWLFESLNIFASIGFTNLAEKAGLVYLTHFVFMFMCFFFDREYGTTQFDYEWRDVFSSVSATDRILEGLLKKGEWEPLQGIVYALLFAAPLGLIFLLEIITTYVICKFIPYRIRA